MTGLFLLAVVGLWVWLVFKASKWVGQQVKSPWWRPPSTVLAFAALLALPVADEIVGGFQFRALCEKNASQFQMGVGNPEGRTTKVTIDPSHRAVEGTAIPISHTRLAYHDVATGELVIAFDSYGAKGGLLIRALGISNNNSPLTIGLPVCSPQKGTSVHLTKKFNVIN